VASATKDTIYIDIDDEITSIIDKVQGSKHKIIALVLPKRATALQSIVNMRLLKRVGEETEKSIVLITSEANLLSLAGIVGMYVAKTPQSKPAIPAAPKSTMASDTLVDDDTPDADVDPHKSVGELAGVSAKSVALGSIAMEETIDVDNTDEGVEAAAIIGGKAKRIKIPDFEKFRIKLFLAFFLLIALIVGGILGLVVLPKASIIIKTDNTSLTSTINVTAQVAATAVDTDKSIVPAVSMSSPKTDSVKVTATGQKNEGTPASGTMTAINCTDTATTVPAGTIFTNNGFSFATAKDVSVPPSNFFSAANGGGCKKDGHADVAVTATTSGGASNLSGNRTYASNFSSTLTGTGSAMSGGTDKLVTIVSQQDVDAAAASLVDKSKDAAVSDTTKLLTAAKLVPFTETIANAAPVVTSSPAVGADSADVTVTSVTTYTMLGVKTDYLDKLVALDAGKQIVLAKQPITDYGLNKAVIHLTSKRDANDQSVSLQTVVVAGTKIDPNAIKKQIAGKKRGDVQQIIESNPGVKDVIVNYSPFWVSKVPSKPTKVTIVFQQTNANGK
jgi:hypothetical protein